MAAKDISNVRRIRYYRSDDRDLPIEEWEMVADVPLFANSFSDNKPNETGRTYYYCARYVFDDGTEGTPSAITECAPYDPKDAVMKQQRDLN